MKTKFHCANPDCDGYVYEIDDGVWGCDECKEIFTELPENASPAVKRPGKDQFGNDEVPEAVL